MLVRRCEEGKTGLGGKEGLFRYEGRVSMENGSMVAVMIGVFFFPFQKNRRKENDDKLKDDIAHLGGVDKISWGR